MEKTTSDDAERGMTDHEVAELAVDTGIKRNGLELTTKQRQALIEIILASIEYGRTTPMPTK